MAEKLSERVQDKVRGCMIGGAVAGNIAGAICGYDKIPDKWKEKLELEKLILELSDDLYMGCRINEYTAQEDPVWVNKYTPPCIP